MLSSDETAALARIHAHLFSRVHWWQLIVAYCCCSNFIVASFWSTLLVLNDSRHQKSHQSKYDFTSLHSERKQDGSGSTPWVWRARANESADIRVSHRTCWILVRADANTTFCKAGIVTLVIYEDHPQHKYRKLDTQCKGFICLSWQIVYVCRNHTSLQLKDTY